jgi:uncharacterized membrane protein YkgB
MTQVLKSASPHQPRLDPASRAGAAFRRRMESALTRAHGVTCRFCVPLLRISFGLIFVWFGALKVADVTPVARLVAETVPFLPSGWFVPALGMLEIAIGIALLLRRWITAVVMVMIGHLAGTFMVLLVQPEVAFQDGNPLLLTMTGEFVVKNIVLISAGLVIAVSSGRRDPETGGGYEQVPLRVEPASSRAPV